MQENDFLKELIEFCSARGISGREEKIRELVISHLPENINYTVDNIGNLIVEIGHGEENIALMAHMDEIGLMITGITSDGLLMFRKIGGFDDRLLLGAHLDVVTERGVIDGVIGVTPPHLGMNQSTDNLRIDIGAHSKQEAEELGVKVMDFAVFKKHMSILNNKYLSMRSLDDRFGCVALLRVLNNVVKEDLKKRVFFVWTVQEEIGLKGAKAFVSKHDIDLCYAIDSFACCSSLTGDVACGRGPVLRMVDNSAIASYDMMKKILGVAREYGIPVQVGITGGGTDGSVAIENNAKMVPIALAVKYLHSQAEYISLNDFEKLVELLTVLVKQ
ncbi:M42 family metallopeptidase [Thermotoga profunda]|uniref:M42 family metallopeptidase n=1 Tax=Thermotoga profunda TaxID=1508420 RepID=UPI000A8AFB78|nr:M42 family metallopeptidase [Thermotoga profunda]